MSYEAVKWAFQQEIKQGPKFVLVAIAERSKNGKCFPGQYTIGNMCGMNRTTVNEHVRYLKDKGLIEVIRRSNDSGHRTSNLYVLNLTKVLDRDLGKPKVPDPYVGFTPPLSPDLGQEPEVTRRSQALLRPPKIESHTIPENWTPGVQVYRWGEAKGVTREFVDQLVPEFIAYWSHTKKKRKEWDTTFMRNPVVKQAISTKTYRKKLQSAVDLVDEANPEDKGQIYDH